jgi:beta-lactamase regulating signal transducer with metallopeptidase domain
MLLWWVFQNVVVTAALALAVAMVCRVVRPGPVVRHALWVLVLVKFLTPPLVVWPWAAPDPLGLAAIGAEPAPVPDVARDVHFSSAGPLADAGAVTPASAPAVYELDAPADVSVLPWLLAIWIAGSAGLLGIEGARLARISRRIRSAQAADPAISARVAELAQRLGLRPVPVLGVAGISSPMIWCLGRPRLLWPATIAPPPFEPRRGSPPDPALDGVLVHELAHVKRRDHFVGWIELAAGVIWWWNPLFWYVRSAMREQAELACDAWVISALPDGRRAYAESLLALSGATVRGASPISMAAVIGIRASSRRVLERRLVMIMQGRAPLRLSLAGLLSLVIVAAATLPAWATEDQQPAQAVQAVVAPQTRPSTAAPQPTQGASQAPQTRPATTPAPARATTTRPQPAQRAVPIEHSTYGLREVAPEQAPRPRFAATTKSELFHWATDKNLPADGQKLLQGFETDRESIQKEADQKIEARKASLVKQLTDLQNEYAKAGKLDEAIAIRDYIRSGALDQKNALHYWIKR